MKRKLKGRGGPGRGQGRKRTAHVRLMHLASCIDDWVEETNRERGSVKRAMLDLYNMQYANWSDEDVATTGKLNPPDLDSFLRTIKKDLRDGRRISREWREFLPNHWPRGRWS